MARLKLIKIYFLVECKSLFMTNFLFILRQKLNQLQKFISKSITSISLKLARSVANKVSILYL
jgi:hypothetical protein